MDKSPKRIQHIFDKISNYYDFMNNVMSFGMHKIIKKQCVKMLDVPNKARVLDLCCGTGDTAWLIKNIYKRSNVIGIDTSDKMLSIARKKCKYVEFYNMDVNSMSFEKCYFDTVTCTFGLRNLENIENCLASVYRLLRHGGEFMNLDFGNKNFLSKLFDIYILFVSRILKKNYLAYRYLVESKREFLTPDELIKLAEKCGLKLTTKRDFFFGAISMQIFTK